MGGTLLLCMNVDGVLREEYCGLDVRGRFEEQRAEMTWRPPVTGKVRRLNEVGVTARATGMTGLLAAERR